MSWWHVLLWIVGSVLIFDALVIGLMIYTARENLRQEKKRALRFIVNGERL